jgi:hypothetical protein
VNRFCAIATPAMRRTPMIFIPDNYTVLSSL